MPKIKIQIEADDDEFSIEDLEDFLFQLQANFDENASHNDTSPWSVSIIGKNGSLTPISEKEGLDDEDESDDQDEEYYNDFEDDEDS